MAIKLHESFAIHPGPWLLEEIVKPYGMTVSSAAEHLKVTRPALSRVLNGRAALTPGMAIRFEKAFGISAATMLRMQSAHDLAQAKHEAASINVTRVPEPAI
jgi:addiction module HigA family antidote